MKRALVYAFSLVTLYWGVAAAQTAETELTDQSLVSQAAQGLQTRIDFSTIGLMRQPDREFKAFLQELGGELQNDQAELRVLAGRINLRWPPQTRFRARDEVERLSRLPRGQLESEIIEGLRQSVQTDLALLERAESSESLDPALRQWAADASDDLRALAKDLKRQKAE